MKTESRKGKQVIQTYVLKQGESVSDALWSSGVYTKKDIRSYKEAAVGMEKCEMTHGVPYLVNGFCHTCGASPDEPHYACYGSKMTTIMNFIVPLCPICEKQALIYGGLFCGACEDEAELCSCWTPGFCEQEDEHDEAYYAKKRKEWKAKLASLGILEETK